jgi:hypothetical protein
VEAFRDGQHPYEVGLADFITRVMKDSGATGKTLCVLDLLLPLPCMAIPLPYIVLSVMVHVDQQPW